MSFLSHSSYRAISFFLKFSFFSLLLLSVAVFAGGRLASKGDTAIDADSAASAMPTFTIIVDAGHGGRDGGASADDDGTLEKHLNLAVAKKLAALLETANVRVVMTREDDIELADPSSSHKKLDDFKARIAIAEQYENALFVSIHMNKFPIAKYSGLQVYYSVDNPGSRVLAGQIQSDSAAYLRVKNERKIKPAGDSIYILSHLEMPAVLVECGFLSNYEEKERLKTEDYQRELAMSLYTSILTYLSQQTASDT